MLNTYTSIARLLDVTPLFLNSSLMYKPGNMNWIAIRKSLRNLSSPASLWFSLSHIFPRIFFCCIKNETPIERLFSVFPKISFLRIDFIFYLKTISFIWPPAKIGWQAFIKCGCRFCSIKVWKAQMITISNWILKI